MDRRLPFSAEARSLSLRNEGEPSSTQRNTEGSLAGRSMDSLLLAQEFPSDLSLSSVSHNFTLSERSVLSGRISGCHWLIAKNSSILQEDNGQADSTQS